MQTKLTLSIEKDIIEKAKQYAKLTQRSLSELVGTYLENITNPPDEELDKDLAEIVGAIELPEGFDEKDSIRKILHSKHLG